VYFEQRVLVHFHILTVIYCTLKYLCFEIRREKICFEPCGVIIANCIRVGCEGAFDLLNPFPERESLI